MKIAIGNSRMDKKWKNKDISWETFIDMVRTTRRTTETVSEFRKMTKATQDSVKDIGGFVGGALREGTRRNGHVVCRSMLTLDMDFARADVWDQIDALYDFKCLIYSTHKHTPEAPRLRLIIPLSREVTEEEYPALSRQVAKDIGIDMFDDTTYESARLMYWPSTPSDGEYVFYAREGSLLNPEEYLSRYVDWRDTSQWPVSKRQAEVIHQSIKAQEDPLTKEGVVGAFCRAYSIEGAIESFLQDVYEPSALHGRYDYIPADSSAGLVVYESKFAYSHHATDPVGGKLLNAFDLVRCHRFKGLDEKASFKAMSEFSVADELVKLELLAIRKARAAAEFQMDKEWEKLLTLDKNGCIKDSLSNISTILRFDPALKPIVYNQFTHMIDVVGQLPWPQVKPGWSDTDLACMKIYFEARYGIWSPMKFKDALLGVVSVERLYHPIKAYLDTLSWDGIPRLDKLLIDYLGAEDTPYVRAVTRKTLVAAVARVYKPGTKFDSILVLNGSQGIGKSTIFSILGGKWYSDSLSLSDMKDKTASEKLQGYWILELGELAGIKKVDVETVKSFITRTDDKYRHAYGVNVESHPRSSIIVGTTNSDGGFLRDVTGNRRFWPVRVVGKGTYHAWELHEVDQVWAEALAYYLRGEVLFLVGGLMEEAATQQREALENDDREGLVLEYLEMRLPEAWPTMDLYSRRNFITGGEFGESHLKGVVHREQVCIMEIWCECFGQPRENIKKGDSYEIEGILGKIGGWKKFDGTKTGKRQVPLYGPQRIFVRDEGVN